jgi:NagD protein
VTAPREIRSWLMDMDGVLIHEDEAIPGAPEFLTQLRELGSPFLVLTNNSMYTPRDLAARLRANGLDVPEHSIWTSALATARFLQDQRPNGSAFVVGEAGLTTALHDVGYTLSDRSPDYVVLGETRTYSFERITKAIRLITAGARFIATNPDNVGPTSDGPLPATGSLAALMSRAAGVDPYYVGKPNPLMMRSALNTIDAHSEHTAMIGDRMDTDVVAGLEAGLHTILVLTGVSTRKLAERYPYRPSRIVDSVADLVSGLSAKAMLVCAIASGQRDASEVTEAQPESQFQAANSRAACSGPSKSGSHELIAVDRTGSSNHSRV